MKNSETVQDKVKGIPVHPDYKVEEMTFKYSLPKSTSTAQIVKEKTKKKRSHPWDHFAIFFFYLSCQVPSKTNSYFQTITLQNIHYFPQQ